MNLYNFFGGRSTFFALVFMTAGIILAFKGSLTPSYIALAGAIQTLLVTRAVAEDYHQRNNGGSQ
jgi:hypothetical protein